MRLREDNPMTTLQKKFRSLNSLLFICPLSLIFLTHCGKPAGEHERIQGAKNANRPPVIEYVSIQPGAPTAGQDLWADVKAKDPDGDPVEYDFEWMVNGAEVPNAAESTLPSGWFQKGDEVKCLVVPSDGRIKGQPEASQTITIANSPPVIDEIRIEPDVLRREDEARVVVEAHDLDGDPITVKCDWYTNDRCVRQGEDAFSVNDCKPRDFIYAVVSVSDGEAQSPWTQSKTIMVQNNPPRIVSEPPANWDSAQGFQYVVETVDQDGDPVQVHVEGELPPGMVWNGQTSLLAWNPPAELEGEFPLKIVAEDNNGGVFSQTFTLTLKSAKQGE
jgi:hypothetical protein